MIKGDYKVMKIQTLLNKLVFLPQAVHDTPSSNYGSVFAVNLIKNNSGNVI